MKIGKYMAIAATMLAVLSGCQKESLTELDNPTTNRATALNFTLPQSLAGFSEGTATRGSVGGFEEDNRKWQKDDVMMAEITLTGLVSEPDNLIYIGYTIYTTLTHNGSTTGNPWAVSTDPELWVKRTHTGSSSIITPNSGTTQMLRADADGKVYLVLPAELAAASSIEMVTTLTYAAGMEWKVSNDGTSVDFALKAGTPAGTTQPWSKINEDANSFAPTDQQAFAAAIATSTNFIGEGNTLAAASSRLRIYTGRPGDEVKIATTSRFFPAAGGKTVDYTYTATTDAVGNAYFYGYTYSATDLDGSDNTKTFVVTLTNLLDATTGAAKGDVEIFAASTTSPVDINFYGKAGKSLAIDGTWAVMGTQKPTAQP